PLPSHLKNNHGMDNRITDAMQIRVDTLYVSIYDLKDIHFPTKETIMTSKPKTRSHCGHLKIGVGIPLENLINKHEHVFQNNPWSGANNPYFSIPINMDITWCYLLSLEGVEMIC